MKKRIAGFENYSISTDGIVVNEKRGKQVKPNIVKGYYRLQLSKDNKTTNKQVHRLVAEAFIPNPDNLPCVNHKDENKLNNCVDNLEWCTQEYNNSYGTKGQRISKTKSIEVEQYSLDGELIKVWPSAKDAQLHYGKTNKGNISACCNGNRHTAYGFIWKYKSL